MARAERGAAAAAAYLLVNQVDADQLTARLGREVLVVPNGVAEAPTPAPPRDAATICFVGVLDYPPNIDSARRLCTEVLPRVRRAVPSARVVLVGRAPGPEVVALAGPEVEIRADVPDVMTLLATCPPGRFSSRLRSGDA
jgi:polysaccharide biosynthesis protein PslH